MSSRRPRSLSVWREKRGDPAVPPVPTATDRATAGQERVPGRRLHLVLLRHLRRRARRGGSIGYERIRRRRVRRRPRHAGNHQGLQARPQRVRRTTH